MRTIAINWLVCEAMPGGVMIWVGEVTSWNAILKCTMSLILAVLMWLQFDIAPEIRRRRMGRDKHP